MLKLISIGTLTGQLKGTFKIFYLKQKLVSKIYTLYFCV